MAAPQTPLCGTLVCRGTPVGNHCSRVLYKLLQLFKTFFLKLWEVKTFVLTTSKGSSINYVTLFLIIFEKPSPIVTLFSNMVSIELSQNPWFPLPLMPWRHLWTAPKIRLKIQAALVIRGGYVPQKYREYQVLKWPKNRGSVPKF